MCIGLTGRMASGKGEAVRILEQLNFRYISLSDIVREEAGKSCRRVTRNEMQDIGNRLRQQGGAGILGRRVREIIVSSPVERWVIDGIRNPAEILELRKLASFFLVAVESDIELIMARLRSRGRETDRLDDEELRKRLQREWGIGEPDDGQQVGPSMKLADFTVKNNGTLEELKREILKIISKVEEQNER